MSDEFEDELDIEGSSFDEFDNAEKATLGELWQNNSMVKVGVIAVAAIAIFGIIIAFSGKEQASDPSMIMAGSTVKGTPGTEEASSAYVDAVEEKTQERIETAQKEGTSALPTPITPPPGVLDVPEEEVEEEDPLQRWRQIQEERLQRELERSRVVEGPVIEEAQDQSEAIQALAEVMSEQMQAILESQNRENLTQSMQITSPEYLENIALAEQQKIEEEQAEIEEEAAKPNRILPAGRILYGRLLTEANSDTPGPVLAEIQSGPLKGSRLIGDFQVQQTQQLITLNFNTVVYNDQSISINAIAVDPDTTANGMATDVDQRWVKRVVLPAAAAFVEGAAEAIANTGLTTVTVEGDTVSEQTDEADNEQQIASGIEEAGQELGQILDQIAQQTQPLIRIESGTPLGILFLEEVVEETDEDLAEN